MSTAIRTRITEAQRTSIIRVQSYPDKQLQGTFCNLYNGREMPFGNLTRLLLLIEESLCETESSDGSIPTVPTAKVHSKADMASYAQELLPRPKQEVLATFKLEVFFRQGDSWQGKLSWMEGKTEATFRDTLELVKLMDEALSKSAQTVYSGASSAVSSANQPEADNRNRRNNSNRSAQSAANTENNS